MTLGELELMPLDEYHAWIEYSEIEPWGSPYHNQLRADARAGTISAAIANWSGKTLNEGVPPLTPADFMPSLAALEQNEPPQHPADPEEHSALILKAFGL